jgi:hypothetical protein
LRDALEEAAHRGGTWNRVCATGDHDRAGPEVLHLVDAELFNFGTVEPDWDKRVVGGGYNVVFYLQRCGLRGERIKSQQRQRDAGKRYAQAD